MARVSHRKTQGSPTSRRFVRRRDLANEPIVEGPTVPRRPQPSRYVKWTAGLVLGASSPVSWARLIQEGAWKR